DAVGLGPAAVIADRHPDLAAERLPDAKAQIAVLEIELLQVLEGHVGIVDRAAGHMDLAVLADDPPVALDQDRGIVAVALAALLRQLAIAEIEADAEP